MKIALGTPNLISEKGEIVVIPVFEGATPQLTIPVEFKDPTIDAFLKDNPKFGALYDDQLFYLKSQKILLLGAGKKEKIKFANIEHWAGAATRILLTKSKRIALLLTPYEEILADQLIDATTLGVEIASFDLAEQYKSDKEPIKLTEVWLILDKVLSDHKDKLNTSKTIAEAINLARRLSDSPANELTPTVFLTEVRKIAKESLLKLTVIDEKAAKKLGMGAFVGVAQGSDEPSYMIALEYKGDLKSKEKWGIVGKGITFDSGGISIKPSDHMHEMKYDMCGAATTLATMAAIARLKLKVNVVGVMAVTENLISGKAQRPGDIVKTLAGKTAEILNTDAEGRLVLSDGLTYAQRTFKATRLIDLATLTGAIIVGLGDFITGVFSNNPAFATEFISTGARVGEKFWDMPMDEEYNEMVKSDLADLTNIGHGGSMPGSAGAITGAKFLEPFIEDNRPWIHLDIAGTAWDFKTKPYRVVGATGVGLKTLIELISHA